MKNNNYEDALVKYFNKIYNKKLTETEIFEIKQNLSGFFSLLLEMDGDTKDNYE